MSHVLRINHAAQQQAARQGTQLTDLLPRLGTNERELADTLLMLINSRHRHEQRATTAESEAYRLRAALERGEDTIAALQEDKDRLHRQLDAAESRAHAAETR